MIKIEDIFEIVNGILVNKKTNFSILHDINKFNKLKI